MSDNNSTVAIPRQNVCLQIEMAFDRRCDLSGKVGFTFLYNIRRKDTIPRPITVSTNESFFDPLFALQHKQLLIIDDETKMAVDIPKLDTVTRQAESLVTLNTRSRSNLLELASHSYI